MQRLFRTIAAILVLIGATAAEDTQRLVKIRDVTSVEGVRDNPLLGYGIVVGLAGTGDRRQTVFTTQTLANVLQRMGVQIPANSVRVNNVAAVFVTARLPAFARPGTTLDITVSSVGDAKSLEGGLLLLTPLYGPDGRIYAEAQGSLAVGGYSAGSGGTSRQTNHPTVGRIPEGGRVERDVSIDLVHLTTFALLLSDPDFTTADQVARTVNRELRCNAAIAVDGRRVEINLAGSGSATVPSLMARIENLDLQVQRRAKVVVNERTGTVVIGKDVKLGAISILHGGISIQITTEYSVSQPSALSQGQTAVIGKADVQAAETPARRVELSEGASVDQLVGGLQAIGATARDVISVLQAIKAAGALEADLEVL